MVQALEKIQLVTFEEFAQWKPEKGLYELHNGVIVEMAQPTGDHEDIGGFLDEKLTFEYLRLNLPYRIPKTALIKPINAESAYDPDVLILNRPNLVNEPLWKKSATVTQKESIVIAIEVISTNWRDDYFTKFNVYEEMGVFEYWIVDYLGLGGKRFLGDTKQPAILVHELIDGEYEVNLFRGDEKIISPTFPELNLTAKQIFEAGIGA